MSGQFKYGYFLCICRCGGHKVYAKLKTNVDECVGPT